MPDGPWFEPITLGALPGRAAARWGAREAVCFRGRRWTFAEVAAGVDRVARGLMALGVRPGDKVALWMSNRPEWMQIAFAVLKIGAVLVPINTRLRTDDVAYILAQSDSSTLILAERSGPIDYLAMVRELVPVDAAGGTRRVPELQRLVVLGEEQHPATVPWTELLEGAASVEQSALAARAGAVDPDERCEPGHRITASDVLAFCRGRIASFKIPRHVLFVEDFPMTSSGKIQKVKLREDAVRRFRRADG